MTMRKPERQGLWDAGRTTEACALDVSPNCASPPEAVRPAEAAPATSGGGGDDLADEVVRPGPAPTGGKPECGQAKSVGQVALRAR